MDGLEKRMSHVEIHVAEVRKDVEHMKDELKDNISPTMGKIWDKVNEMCPLVKENSFWVGKWKQAIFYLAVVGVGGGLIGLAFFLVKKYASG